MIWRYITKIVHPVALMSLPLSRISYAQDAQVTGSPWDAWVSRQIISASCEIFTVHDKNYQQIGNAVLKLSDDGTPVWYTACITGSGVYDASSDTSSNTKYFVRSSTGIKIPVHAVNMSASGIQCLHPTSPPIFDTRAWWLGLLGVPESVSSTSDDQPRISPILWDPITMWLEDLWFSARRIWHHHIANTSQGMDMSSPAQRWRRVIPEKLTLPEAANLSPAATQLTHVIQLAPISAEAPLAKRGSLPDTDIVHIAPTPLDTVLPTGTVVPCSSPTIQLGAGVVSSDGHVRGMITDVHVQHDQVHTNIPPGPYSVTVVQLPCSASCSARE